MIPIEGGGTVYLRGEVSQQQPKIACGVCALSLGIQSTRDAGPILISEGGVLADMKGGSGQRSRVTPLPLPRAVMEHSCLPSNLPGLVEEQIEWGQMDFTVDGRHFTWSPQLRFRVESSRARCGSAMIPHPCSVHP